MLQRSPDTSSEMFITDHEEQMWLLQQQQPERVVQQVDAWRLGDDVDFAQLTQAFGHLVETQTDLNVRYRFSNEGDLCKFRGEPLHCRLEFMRSQSDDVTDQLRAWQIAPWDAATQPPFKARVFHTEQGAMLAWVRHPILDESCPSQDLLNQLRKLYAKLGPSSTPLALSALPVPLGTAAHAHSTHPQARADPDDMTCLILGEFRTVLAEPDMQPDDDFFDLGGHSLLATRIIGQLMSKHGIAVRFSDFFQSPSAAALARRATLVEHSAAPCAAPAPQKLQQAPMALAQASLWRAHVAYGFGTIFNLPFALDFLDPVDETLFRQAFTDLLARHASLRTTYHDRDDAAHQRTIPMSQLERYSWFWSSTESEGVTLASEAAYRFDLSCELPLRIRFIRDPQSGRQVLSFLVHHMAVDEWSINTMMGELAQAYLARTAGQAPTWAAPALSFCNFAQLQQAQGVNPQHVEYWTCMLRGATRGLQLPSPPGHRPAASASKASTKAQWLEIRPEPGVLDRLHAFARDHDASLFGVIYTAIALSLYKLGSLKDIVIGTSASGRTDPAFYDTVGYFTTMVAHRVRFEAQQSVQALLHDVTRTINDSMPYADVPLAVIQEALGMTPADGLLFDVYVQIHANNALNGTLSTADGDTIRYRQINPDKTESMFGLQFEIMEDVFGGQRSLRLVVTYRSDRYTTAQVQAIGAGITKVLGQFTTTDVGTRTLAEMTL